MGMPWPNTSPSNTSPSNTAASIALSATVTAMPRAEDQPLEH